MDIGLYIFRMFESVNFKASRFSSCKGLLRVCELFQHHILSKDSFHIYLFDKNLEEFLCISPLNIIKYLVESLRLLYESLEKIYYLMFEL